MNTRSTTKMRKNWSMIPLSVNCQLNILVKKKPEKDTLRTRGEGNLNESNLAQKLRTIFKRTDRQTTNFNVMKKEKTQYGTFTLR